MKGLKSEEKIKIILHRREAMIKLCLSACMHCSLCAESCFKFHNHSKDPSYMPSFKALHSIGKIFKKKGKLKDEEFEEIKDLIWNKCVLCMRCYCPVGISIPLLIASARAVCRERGFFRTYDVITKRVEKIKKVLTK